jgi:hypothetical protein
MKFMVICIFAAIAIGAASAQISPERAYQIQMNRVRHLLPPHSALPPLLDLSKTSSIGGGASRKWENRFTGSMGVREISDPGLHGPGGPVSISTATTEYVGPIWALPARSCDAVVMGRIVADRAQLAYNRRFVYSLFSVEVLQVLKGNRKQGVREEERINATQLGGSVRFPSGHMETFILANEGFMELGSQYLLMLWKPIRSDDTYMVAESYLIQGGVTFPIKTLADVSRYDGMPAKDFEAKVKAAIAKNIDTN